MLWQLYTCQELLQGLPTNADEPPVGSLPSTAGMFGGHGAKEGDKEGETERDKEADKEGEVMPADNDGHEEIMMPSATDLTFRGADGRPLEEEVRQLREELRAEVGVLWKRLEAEEATAERMAEQLRGMALARGCGFNKAAIEQEVLGHLMGQEALQEREHGLDGEREGEGGREGEREREKKQAGVARLKAMMQERDGHTQLLAQAVAAADVSVDALLDHVRALYSDLGCARERGIEQSGLGNGRCLNDGEQSVCGSECEPAVAAVEARAVSEHLPHETDVEGKRVGYERVGGEGGASGEADGHAVAHVDVKEGSYVEVRLQKVKTQSVGRGRVDVFSLRLRLRLRLRL